MRARLLRTKQRLLLRSLSCFRFNIGLGSHFAGAATSLLCVTLVALLAAGWAARSSLFSAFFFLGSNVFAALFLVFALTAVFAVVGEGCTRHGQGGGGEEDELLHGGVQVVS